MSDFSPSKQSFYRGSSNKSSRRNKIRPSGGNYASDGFEAQGGYKGSPLKYKTSTYIPDNHSINGDARMTKKASYGKRSPLSSKNTKSEYEPYAKFEGGSSQQQRIQKIRPGGHDALSVSESEDYKTSKYTPSRSSNQRRISKRNIRKLDEKSVPRAPDFSRREPSEYTQATDKRDVFARLKDPDSKIASKAAETLIKNYSDHESEIPPNLHTIISSQVALFCSNNESIKMRAEELVDKCLSNCKASKIVEPVCKTISTANSRSKIMLLEKLNKILPQVAEENPVCLSKHVLPIVYTSLDDRSKYIKKKTEEIVLTLYSLIGSALIEFSPSDKLQTILDII